MQNNDAILQLLRKPNDLRTDAAEDSATTKPNTIDKAIKAGTYTDEWLRQSLKNANVEVYGSSEKQGIRYFYVPCPNESAHTSSTNKTETAVYIYNGYPVFKCQHSHCVDWKFPDFAQAVGIDYVKRTGRTPDGNTHYFADFYEFNKDGVPTKVIDIKVCEWICRNYTLFVLGDLPHFLDEYNRYVLDDGGSQMKRIIQSCIVPRLCKDGLISSIYRMTLYQDRRLTYEDLNQYPVEWVCFQNGFYDPISDRMIPIKPENYVINMIPHEYDPRAKPSCPTFDSLLEFQLPNDDERELWLEFCGKCANRDTSPQKWMIVKGPGGSGKSTQLNVLIDFLGADNVSSETLQGLLERFGATALFGKLANICADISSEDMKRTDVLKKITGEDKHGVKHERKGKDSFFFTPFCDLVFSANEIPLNRDEKSNAFYRRMLITVMDRLPAKVDRNLQRKLHSEIDGIIHRYMDALRRFYDRGGYYIESQRSIAEVNRLRRSADSVIAFHDEELVHDVNGKVERSQLYSEYLQYCDQEERRYPVTRNKLFERFRDMGIAETKTNNGRRYFVGIRLRSPFDDDAISDDFIEVADDEDILFN